MATAYPMHVPLSQVHGDHVSPEAANVPSCERDHHAADLDGKQSALVSQPRVLDDDYARLQERRLPRDMHHALA